MTAERGATPPRTRRSPEDRGPQRGLARWRVAGVSPRTAAGTIDLAIGLLAWWACARIGWVGVLPEAPLDGFPRFERFAAALAGDPLALWRWWIVQHLPLTATWMGMTGIFGRTAGEHLAGILAVDGEGRPVGRWGALRRGPTFLSFPASFHLIPLWIVASGWRRGLHDRISGTWVVIRAIPSPTHRRPPPNSE